MNFSHSRRFSKILLFHKFIPQANFGFCPNLCYYCYFVSSFLFFFRFKYHMCKVTLLLSMTKNLMMFFPKQIEKFSLVSEIWLKLKFHKHLSYKVIPQILVFFHKIKLILNFMFLICVILMMVLLRNLEKNVWFEINSSIPLNSFG